MKCILTVSDNGRNIENVITGLPQDFYNNPIEDGVYTLTQSKFVPAKKKRHSMKTSITCCGEIVCEFSPCSDGITTVCKCEICGTAYTLYQTMLEPE